MVRKIVLTGGPCAGKSTLLKHAAETAGRMGYKIYTLPESATLLIQNGVDFLTPDAHLAYITELSKLRLQIAMEESMSRIAEACGQRAILLCDRGTMDTFAYVPEETHNEILRALGTTEQSLCEERYHEVFHICTAAKGAEQYYTLANNNCRSEAVDLARQVDDRLLQVWQRHPRRFVIEADVDFEKKVHHLVTTLERVLTE